LLGGQLGQLKKNHFLKNKKFQLGFLDLYLLEKLRIIAFLLGRKVRRVLFSRQLRNLYSKIESKMNFEVLYLIQLSIFAKKTPLNVDDLLQLYKNWHWNF